MFRNVVEKLEPRRLLTSYYLSPTGSDANPPGDPAHPWQTIAKLDATSFHAGDSILFQAGQSFAGNLTFGTDDGGTSSSPVSLETYSYDPASEIVTVGSGFATINAGNGHGLFASNTSGFNIDDLNIVGAGQVANSFNGIQFDNSLSGNVQLPYIDINNCTIDGFGEYGITIGGSNGKSGFSNVTITNSNVFNNIVGGIETHGVFSSSATTYANSNVYVGHDTVHDNLGYAGSSNHVGDGIVLSDVNAGTIERCESYNNGTQNTHNGGPVGIWCWDSNSVTIQYNESYDNHTNSTTDGGGFDLDGGDTNCTLQYNYSHDNDGAGLGAFEFSGARPFGSNVIRYNISENDARKNGYGAITLWGNSSTSLQNLDIYNNTIFLTQNTASPKAFYLQSGTQDVTLRNNILDVSGGSQLGYVSGTQSNLQIQGNDYWTTGGAFNIKYGTKTYSTLDAFRSGSGQESLNGTAVGLNVDPMLSSAGNGGTIGNADQLRSLSAYMLKPGSPLIESGLNLMTQFGIGPGAHDFYGRQIPDNSGGFSIGADESLPQLDVIAGTAGTDSITLSEDGDRGDIDWVFGATSGRLPINDAAGLTINGNGGSDTIMLDYSFGNPLPNTLHLNGTFTITGLQNLNGTNLEIGRSTVFISYSNSDPISLIQGYLRNGYNNGAWNGTASQNVGVITSIPAMQNAAQTTAIGYADSADGLIAGQPANTIELKYTLYGDTTLTGSVGFNDFTRLTQHYNQTSGGTWDRGDFNYDGSVNFSDFTLMTRTYNTTLGSLANPAADPGITARPHSRRRRAL